VVEKSAAGLDNHNKKDGPAGANLRTFFARFCLSTLDLLAFAACQCTCACNFPENSRIENVSSLRNSSASRGLKRVTTLARFSAA
jgi:hypothetical protein